MQQKCAAPQSSAPKMAKKAAAAQEKSFYGAMFGGMFGGGNASAKAPKL